MKTLRVLVALDGSPLSATVLPFVARLGAQAARVVEVVEEPPLFGPAPARGEDDARRELARAAALLAELGVPEATTAVRRGSAAAGVLEEAGEVEPGLIALATHGRGGPTARPSGRVARAVIQGSDFPVLAVRPDAGPPAGSVFERVLVPCDGSPLSWRAVEALELLGAAPKGRLSLLGVWEMVRAGAHAGAARHEAGEAIRDPAERYLAQRCEHLRETLDRAARRARDLGFEAHGDVDIGRPAARIVERARACGATLIAMATHGRTGLARYVLGSVTEEVLAAAPAPVLVCRGG